MTYFLIKLHVITTLFSQLAMGLRKESIFGGIKYLNLNMLED